MKDFTLPKEKIAELEKLHRSLRDKRQADRVKAVIALSKVVTAETKDITAPLCDYIQGDVSQHLYPDQYNDHCFKMLGLAGGTEAIGFLKTLINTKFGNDAYETIEKIHLRNKPLTY